MLPSTELGVAVVQAGGILTMTNNAILFPIVISYVVAPVQFPDLGLTKPVNLPILVLYVTVDSTTGQLIDGSVPYTALETNEAFTVPLEEGLVVANGGALTETPIRQPQEGLLL